LKPKISQRVRRALYLAVAWLPLGSPAATLEPGAPMPVLALSDQHDKPLAMGPSTRVVLFTAEKPPNDLVIKVLSAQAAGSLEPRGIVYVADISAMPAVITKLFALPKMRELGFPVGLAREAATVADLPRRPGSVSILHLRTGRVANVQFAQTEAQLLQAMQPTP
jgi:hypothetical protein